MANHEVNAQAGADEFAAVVLDSLKNATRRALLEHSQRGALVPEWSGTKVEWVSAEEKLRHYIENNGVSQGATAVEQSAAADSQSTSRSGRG